MNDDRTDQSRALEADEKAFTSKVAEQLDESINNIDELTQAKLTAARKRAVDRIGQRSRFPGFTWGLATAATVTLAVSLWMVMPKDDLPPSTVDDLEMLTTFEPLEFYEELDFYQWLASDDVLAG